jgi:hypothetical protein
MQQQESESETEYVQELLKFSEVFVYKVPPLTSVQAGHRAETWGLEKPFATCTMKVLAKGDAIMLQLFSVEKQGQLIAACPIALEGDQTLEWWVEQVKDSARYFVIRMVDNKSKKQALLGIGFRDRDKAFEFQEALSHHFRRVMRLRGVKDKNEEQDLSLTSADHPDHDDDDDEDKKASDQPVAAKPAIDLSLKQPIKIAIKGTKTAPASTSSATSPLVPSLAGFSLSLPPAAKTEDVDWGDFESS